jgi:hypothetical protein
LIAENALSFQPAGGKIPVGFLYIMRTFLKGFFNAHFLLELDNPSQRTDFVMLYQKVASRYVQSDSYSDPDIPEYFYLYTKIKQYGEEISNGVLDGVTGISGAQEAVGPIVHDRKPSIILKMPGDLVEEDNELTRIMYDNPYYFTSQNLKFFTRVRDREYSSKYRTLKGMAEEIGDDKGDFRTGKCPFIYTIWKSLGHRRSLNRFEDDTGVRPSRLWSSVLEDHASKTDIQVPMDITKCLIEATISFTEEVHHKAGKVFAVLVDKDEALSELNSTNKKKLNENVTNWILDKAGTVKNEQEWVLKDSRLVVPDDTSCGILYGNVSTRYSNEEESEELLGRYIHWRNEYYTGNDLEESLERYQEDYGYASGKLHSFHEVYSLVEDLDLSSKYDIYFLNATSVSHYRNKDWDDTIQRSYDYVRKKLK